MGTNGFRCKNSILLPGLGVRCPYNTSYLLAQRGLLLLPPHRQLNDVYLKWGVNGFRRVLIKTRMRTRREMPNATRRLVYESTIILPRPSPSDEFVRHEFSFFVHYWRRILNLCLWGVLFCQDFQEKMQTKKNVGKMNKMKKKIWKKSN